MEKENLNISKLLESLRKDSFKSEVYEIILKAAESKKHKDTGGNVFSPNDYALDFIVYLKENLGIGDIRTKNDLLREFNRWYTRTRDPEGHELWSIISDALRSLEAEGICERDEKFRNFSNNNTVLWYLPEFRDRKKDWNDIRKDAENIPLFSPANRKNARIVTPSKAKELVFSILKTAESPITMEQIIFIARKKVVLTGKPVENTKIDEDGEETDIFDTIGDKRSTISIITEESVIHYSNLIWEEIAEIQRGRQKKIKGSEILCLYFLPAEIFNCKVNLSEFGPTSTAGDVLDDVRKVFVKYLTFDEFIDCVRVADFSLEEIISGIIDILNKICSENGYKTGL